MRTHLPVAVRWRGNGLSLHGLSEAIDRVMRADSPQGIWPKERHIHWTILRFGPPRRPRFYEIGALFGAHHTTIIHGVKSVCFRSQRLGERVLRERIGRLVLALERDGWELANIRFLMNDYVQRLGR